MVKPAEQTPTSIMVPIDLIKDVLPKGVLNVVTGFGPEAGKPLALSPRIAKVAFTGETTTGRFIMKYASENLIPVTIELEGKGPNIFIESYLMQYLSKKLTIGANLCNGKPSIIDKLSSSRGHSRFLSVGESNPET